MALALSTLLPIYPMSEQTIEVVNNKFSEKSRFGKHILLFTFEMTPEETVRQAGQAGITAVASALKIDKRDEASAADVVAAASKMKMPKGVLNAKVEVVADWTPTGASAVSAAVAAANKASYDKAIAHGMTPEVASLVSGHTPALTAEQIVADIGKAEADTMAMAEPTEAN